MQTERARRGFAAQHAALAAVFLLLGGALAFTGVQSLTPLPTVSVAPVVSAAPEQQAEQSADPTPTPSGPTVAVQAPGWLEADPFFIAATALTGGVIEQVLVLEGDSVEAGQILATMIDDDATLEVAHAQANLSAAQASVEAARARLTAAQTDWDEPVERQRAVATTRAHADEIRAELEQLPALIAKEQAIAEKRREEYERAKRAFDSGAASDTELIIATQEYEAQQATVESIKLREPIIANKLRELEAEYEAAARNAKLRIEEREALDAAKAGLLQAEANEALAKAALDTAQLRLDRMTIRAPISGYVQRRLKLPGDKAMLDADDPHSAHIVHLYDPAKIQVRVDVPLADASNIGLGQPCEVVVDVLPDRTFRGVVTRITHEADLQKNTLQAKVRVIDPSPLLRPEMLTRVRFLPGANNQTTGATAARADATIFQVPDASIDTSPTTSVWVVRDRRQNTGEAIRITVDASSTEDGWTTVTGDLLPTDLVILDPTDLSPGDRVRLKTVAEGGAQ